MENNLLEQKVNDLISKYKQSCELTSQLREKIIALESTNAQQNAKIRELEEELLNKSINDEELCKNIEEALGLGQ